MGNSDSRTIFRDHIQFLVNENVQDREELWDMLFSLQVTFSDVFSMIPEADIQNLVQNQKANLEKLLDICLSILEDSVVTNDLTAAKASTCGNALKILTRITPFIINDVSFMWTDQHRSAKLITNLLKLLFTTGFCIPNQSRSEESVWNVPDTENLWEKGLGKKEKTGQTTGQMWQNRYEVLNLLLTMCSTELYSEDTARSENLVGVYLTSKANRYLTSMLYSILNSVTSYNPMGNWKLPYGSYFNYEYQEKTIKSGMQLLSSLLLIISRDTQNLEILSSIGLTAEDYSTNCLREKLSKISAAEDLQIIYMSLKDLISIVTISQNTYLPGSVKDIQFKQELVLLMWVLVKYNSHFLVFLESVTDSHEILIPLIQLMETGDFLITSTVAYLILILTTVRSFSSGLYRPFPNITTDLPLFQGNYSDFLILSYCKLIFVPSVYYVPLFPYFLMAISNISPYIRAVTPIAAQGLIRLLEKFSVMAWLYEAKDNNFLLFNITEAINNLIWYQWAAAHSVVLTLLRKKQTVLKIFKVKEKWDEGKKNETWLNREWFNGWTQRLNFEIIEAVLKFMGPKLEGFTKLNPKANDEAILAYIAETTLVGLIPPPAQISVRTLEINESSERCEKLYLWSFIFVKSIPYQIAPQEKIRLIRFAE